MNKWQVSNSGIVLILDGIIFLAKPLTGKSARQNKKTDSNAKM